MKKHVYAIALTAAFLSLLVNRTFAFQIRVFAPLWYAGVPPSFPTAFASWGVNCTSGLVATINPDVGGTYLKAWAGGGTIGGAANSWFNTGWYTFNNATQGGSVHADTDFWYTISGSAGVRVYLWVYEWNGSLGQVWTKCWSDATSTSGITKTVDLGLCSGDLSNSSIQFQWINGCQYYTRVLMQAFVSWTGQAIIEGRYNDVLWITYSGSPYEHWVQSNPEQAIQMNPVIGPVGTEVEVNGTGFASGSPVNPVRISVYYDDVLVNKTFSDGYGNFTTSFTVPSSPRGSHVVKVVDSLGNTAVDFFDVFIEAPPITGDLNADGAVNILDAIILANNFGKTDPNIDPPGTIVAQDLSTSISVLASMAAASIGLLTLRKKITT
jgi:hypothetical protein